MSQTPIRGNLLSDIPSTIVPLEQIELGKFIPSFINRFTTEFHLRSGRSFASKTNPTVEHSGRLASADRALSRSLIPPFSITQIPSSVKLNLLIM